MAAITLNIGGNTRQLDRDIQKTVNKVYTINLKTKGDQPLGRITGQVNEFNKSLDASNARVIAFGASAGIIFGVERAFTALVSATIEVQKSLQDINVILNVSQGQLQKFGGELFNIAKNTGQSFQEVAKAATEFSRQGLGIEETLKRTSEALILSRLSGLDAAKSVESLTAAVNSFASQAVTATEVVNKFATVDAAFAVSSADLADAIARVGSSAAQSGVSLNELIAIVTSAQQTTARGGAVIGNSFKTIFTRLQREKVVDLLESLGISGTDSSGQVKSTIQLLQDLGAVYDTLGSQQQAYVAEQVGGVFQINILKAALADLGKEYSIYSSALNVAAGATDQAIRRNEELNKTYAAQINALAENARQLAAAGGERLLGPSIDRLVGGSNTLLEGFNESDGKGVGEVLGKGILDGLGQFIAGPGLALLGGVLLKLFRDLGKFATGSVQQLLGLNTAATQQRDLQESISQILSKNPQLLELALKGELGLNQAANSLLTSLQNQTVELQKQATVAQQISRAFVAQAGVRVSGGVPVAPTGRAGKAAGYIPNFAQGDFAREELLAKSLGAKNPTAQLSKGTIDGKKFIKNNREVEITGFGKNGDSAVIPNYAKGFVPNFAEINKKNVGSKYSYLVPSPGFSSDLPSKKTSIGELFGVQVKGPVLSQVGTVSDSIENRVRNSVLDAATRYTQELQPLGRTVSRDDIENGFGKVAGAKGALQSAIGSAFEVGIIQSLDYKSAQREKGGDFDVRGGANLSKIQKLFGINTSIADFKVSTSPDNVSSFYDKIIKESGAGAFSQKEKEQNARSIALRQLRTKYPSAFTEKGLLRQNLDPTERKRIETLLGKTSSTILRSRFKASGYIPNFAAIQDAVSRERAAGIPSSQIYLAQEQALTGANSMGLGVFNKKDEPTKGSRKNAMRSKGFARGYIPNFAETPESSAASIGTVAGALVSQLGLLAITLQGSGREYKESLQEISKSNVESAKKQTSAARERVLQEKDFSKRPELRKEYLAAKSQEKTSARVSAGQKLGAGVRAGGFGLGIAAPILAQTLTQAIPQDTKTGRVSAAGVGALGNIGAATATGAAFGPIGAAVGLAAGALLEIPNVVNQFTSDLPELTKSTQKAQESLQQINDSGTKFLQSFENYNKLLSEGADPAILQKAQDEYSKALYGLSEEQQQTLTSAASVGKLQEAYAKILEEATKKKAIEEFGDALGTVAADIADFSSSLDAIGFFGTGKSQLDVSTEEGKTRTEKITKTLESELTFGKSNEEIIKLSGGLKSLSTASAASETGFESYIDQLTNTGALSEKSAGQLKKMGDDIAYSQGRAAASSQVLNVLANVFGLIGDKAKNAQKASADLEYNNKRVADAQKKARTVIDATISSIQKNISVQNLLKSTLGNTAESFRSLSADLNISKELTQPAQVLESLIGTTAKPAMGLRAQSDTAIIKEQQRTGLATAGLDLKTEIRDILGKPFQENLNKIIEKLGTERGNLTGAPEEIKTRTAVLGSEAKTEQAKLTQVMQNTEGLMKDFINGQTTSEKLLDGVRTELGKVGINTERGTVVSNQIEMAVANYGSKSVNEYVKAFQQRAKLANETKQAILQSRIDQALGTFGGFEGFMNRPEEDQNYIQKIGGDLGKIQNIRGSSAFRYTNKESIEEQEKQAPELGRSFANVYKELIAQSGGGFRDFLQQTIDQGMQQTGVESRGTSPGAGMAGGFDDIVRGRQQDIEQQLKLAEDQIKVTTDPALKRDLQGFVDSIRKMPGGTKGIAQLQTQKELGVARQGDFAKLYGKYENESLNRLKDISPELAASLESAISLSDDPLVAEAQLQSALLTDAVGYLSPIQSALLQIANSGSTSIAQTGASKIEGYAPKLTEEQQKKADEFRKKQEEVAKKEADIKVKKAQEAGMPKDNRTAAQIEAETTAKRDKAREAGMTLEEYTKQVQGPVMGPQVSPDYAKYQELKKPGQTFKSQEDFMTNFLQRLNFEKSGKIFSPEELGVSQKASTQAPIQETSFVQQEAAINNNTTAINTLNEGIRNLGTTLTEKNNANVAPNNQTPGRAGVTTGGTPQINTTTSAPVTVVVQAQGGTDIATAVGQAVQNAIPTIIEKVRVAMGEKIPPSIPKPIITETSGG